MKAKTVFKTIATLFIAILIAASFALSPAMTKTVQAWDCSQYQFRVLTDGTVQAENLSSSAEAAQTAKVYINNVLVNTLNAPALDKNTSWTPIGSVTVPAGSYTWKVVGSSDCQNSGRYDPPTATPTATATPSSPTIVSVCTESLENDNGDVGYMEYNWTITMPGNEADYNMDFSTDGVNWSGPINWSDENDLVPGGGYSGPMTTTSDPTWNVDGSHLWVRWTDFPSIETGPVSGIGLCNPPTETTVVPTTETPVPTTETPVPTTETVVPTTETVVPTTETVVPTTETVVPTTETPIPTTETPVPTTNTPTIVPVVVYPYFDICYQGKTFTHVWEPNLENYPGYAKGVCKVVPITGGEVPSPLFMLLQWFLSLF